MRTGGVTISSENTIHLEPKLVVRDSA